MKTYSEKLKDPRWQKRRLEVLSRDEFKCNLCDNSKKTLHVHHKKYIYGNQPWEYELENFNTLCEKCHEVVEDVKKKIVFREGSDQNFTPVKLKIRPANTHSGELYYIYGETLVAKELRIYLIEKMPDGTLKHWINLPSNRIDEFQKTFRLIKKFQSKEKI